MKQPLLGLTLTELQAVVKNLGMPGFAAKQIASWLYGKKVASIDEMTNLSLKHRELLKDIYEVGGEAPVDAMRSVDGTVKYLYRVGEGHYVDEIPDEDEDGVFVYYFGDSPKEGAMKTGTMTMEIDGDKYYYSFEKSGSKKGAGTDGIDGDSIYVKGRRLEAEEGTKYQPVTYKDETYLISTSGKLVKNKKNVKDSDDVYYKTDSKGRIVDSGTEKPD